MRHDFRRREMVLAGVLAPLLLVGLAPPRTAAADAVLDWNATAFEAAAAGGQNNLVISRTMAMVQLAVHDALNALVRRYEPYLYVDDRTAEAGVQGGAAELGVAADAAIAAASRDVLVAVIAQWGAPEQRARAVAIVDRAHAVALAELPAGLARKHGIAVGQAAAAAMLAARRDDGAGLPSQYRPGHAPGRWRPHPNPIPPDPPVPDAALAAGNLPAMLPQWARLRPFAMVTPWQFRLPGPPALASAEYARDYDEVKRLGGKRSRARTAEQSEIARYWYEGSALGWSRIARVVAAQRRLDRWEGARLLALIEMAIADSYIAGFDSRYVHDLWRPVTAIRAGAADGNRATRADPTWQTFLNTPPIPEYPSTHSIAGAAAAAVLARFFGGDRVAFIMTSGPPFAGIARSFGGFSQAARENTDSRVYAGVHFRTACRRGLRLGDRIGRRVFVHHLQPYRNGVPAR